MTCGSGAVSIEPVNRGIDPSRIWMLDISSGEHSGPPLDPHFNLDVFDRFWSELPNDKRDFKAHMLSVVISAPVGDHEVELIRCFRPAPLRKANLAQMENAG